MIFGIASAFAQQVYPPLALEIGPDRPLLVFGAVQADDPAVQVQRLGELWAGLPEDLKPFSALRIDVVAPDAAARQARYQSILSSVQALNIPVVLVVARDDLRSLHPVDLLEQLLSAYTCVKGMWVADIPFNDFQDIGGGTDIATPPQVRWLVRTIDTAARYGRFVALRLGEGQWPHLMANARNKPLFDMLRTCSNYVVPVAGFDGGDTLTQQGIAMGLWLEGAAMHWGIDASPDWFRAARFIEPGVFGASKPDAPMPPPYYRAMILNGAMGGATVYAIDSPQDLWNGERSATWHNTINPTLHDLINLGLIPRIEFVAKKAVVGLQLNPARTPAEQHVNLRDIDANYDEGLMLRGAYGLERPGQVPELIPNTGSHYWVPILSPFNEPRGFARVIRPGTFNTAGEWTQLLDQYLVPDGTGPAFVTRVGRGVFVMHTRENLYEKQAFSIPALPAPVTGITAVRQDLTVTVTWPFREGDVTYRVYKRWHPDGAYELVADKLEQRTWTEQITDPQQPLAYSVTALTNEQAPYEGTVNFGDYYAFSAVYSRIGEEAVITPLVMTATSQPIVKPDTRPDTQEWWPSFQGAPDDMKPVATEIATRIEQWDAAFTAEDLAAIADVYAPNYQDPQTWTGEYVKRAYQWFFERYTNCRMARQIRQWDFSNLATAGKVRVLLYCRFTGTAISDPTGRIAAVPAHFPLSETGEVWLTFIKTETTWRIEHTEPALPNFRELLQQSAGPYDNLPPGPDTFGATPPAP